MKKILILIAAAPLMLFLTSLTVNKSDQTAGTAQKPIPADVMKIVDKSCAACHKDPGMKMAQGPLNLSGWDKYTAEKQAAKANAMCNLMTKGKMPPKKYQANNPGAVPTADDIKTVCSWASSLKAK